MSKKKIISKAQVLAKVVPTKVSMTNTNTAKSNNTIKPLIAKSVVKPAVNIVSKPDIKSSVNKPVIKPIIKSLPKLINNKQANFKDTVDKINATPIQKEIAVKTEFKKKKLAAIIKENETYFVYLKNPLDYRRHLLESSRKILFCLRSHQKIFLIRQKKLEEMNKLKISVRELLYLNKKFNEKLPKYNIHLLDDAPSQDMIKPAHIKFSTAKKLVEVKHEKTEMDRLEESLANIERKLKTLQ